MLSEILKLLPKLTPQELETLKAALNEFQPKVEDQEPPLWRIITDAVGTPVPWGRFTMGVNNVRFWQRYAPPIDAFFARNFPEATKLQIHALMTFTIGALIDDLKGRGVPITVGTVVKNLGRFRAVFEDQFPGYITSGLAGLILMTMESSR